MGRPALSAYHNSARDMCQGFGTCVGTVSVDMKMEGGGGQLFLSLVVSIRNQYLFGNARIR